MLMLAGVSLNAIVGDNGIITNAQNATIKSSVAVLEEFLNEEYLEIATNNLFEDNEEKAPLVALQSNTRTNEYFFIPNQEGVGGLNYIVDDEGRAIYLIKKSGLPKEISNQIKGGTCANKITGAGKSDYALYAALEDVYGVTSDLKVYYCKNGIDSINNIKFDEDEKGRIVYEENSSLAQLINSDGKAVTAEQARGISKLNIYDGTNLKFNEFYNFSGLSYLIVNNYSGSLEGIQNASALKSVIFKNCNITDFSPLGAMSDRLVKLFLFNSNDSQLELLCSQEKGIANYDFLKLTQFAVFSTGTGIDEFYLERVFDNSWSPVYDYKSNVTSISCLKNLSQVTKSKITHINLINNKLTSLEGLADFKNIYYLSVSGNLIESLSALNGIKVTYLLCANNSLGKNELFNENSVNDSLIGLSNNEKLYYLNLNGNTDLKWISYLKNDTNLRYLYLEACTNIIDLDFAKIASIVAKCSENCKFDSKYSLTLLDENSKVLDLNNQPVSKTAFESLKLKTKLEKLNLRYMKLLDSSGNVITDSITINSTINSVLSSLINLTNLDLRGISGLSTIDFSTKTTKLRELVLVDTGVINLKNLNEVTTLRTLFVNNPDIILSGENGIEATISNLFGGDDSTYWIDRYEGGGRSGFVCYDWNLMKKLEDCSNISKLYMNFHNAQFTKNDILDLSKCSNLTYFECCRLVVKIKMPSSLTIVSAVYQMPEWDFSLCTSLNELYFEFFEFYNVDRIKEKLSTIPESAPLVSLQLSLRHSSVIDLSFLSALKCKENVERFTIRGCYCYNYVTTSLNGIQNLTNVKYVSCIGMRALEKLEGIEECTNLLTFSAPDCRIQDLIPISSLINLRSLNLYNNQIYDLWPLVNLENLGKSYINYEGKEVLGNLNLGSNNGIANTSSYYKESEVEFKDNTSLRCIKAIHDKTGINQIILNPNTGIINYKFLIDVGWDYSTGNFN